MNKSKVLSIGIVTLLLLAFVAAAIIPKDDWDFKEFYNLFNAKNITARYIDVKNVTLNNTILDANSNSIIYFENGTFVVEG